MAASYSTEAAIVLAGTKPGWGWDISILPADVLTSIIASASQDVAEIIRWRITSRFFKDACMQVLQHKLEAMCPHGPGFDRIDSPTVGPMFLKSSKSLEAAVRLCPLLQRVQWQPKAFGIYLEMSICALMASCCLHLTHLSLGFCTLPHAAMSVLGQSQSLLALSLQNAHILPYEKNALGHRDDERAWQGFPQLHCLDVSWSFGLAFSDLLKLAPQLLSLSVHGCQGDRANDPLCRHLRKCVCLDICGTGIHHGDLSALIEAAPYLTHLYVSDRYSNVWSDPLWTDGAMEELQRRRPDILVRRLTSPLAPSEYERLGTKSLNNE